MHGLVYLHSKSALTLKAVGEKGNIPLFTTIPLCHAIGNNFHFRIRNQTCRSPKQAGVTYSSLVSHKPGTRIYSISIVVVRHPSQDEPLHG